MDFDLNEDRRMLSDSLTRYLSEQYDVAHRNTVAYAEPFHDPAKWAELAELGVFYALAAEEAGGFGGTGFDISTVFEALGGTLCPEPVLPALMALRLLHAAGADLEPLLAGSTRYALGLAEIDAPYDAADVSTRADQNGDTWTLTGRKSVVYGGQVADILLIAAQHTGGLGLFEVAPEDAQTVGYGMIDGGGAAEIILENTPARLVLENAAPAIAEALDAGALALCAEAVGAMDATRAILLEYLKTRKQFGIPIGKFQVLQHRMVDLDIEIEQARSITILAASKLLADGASRTVSMAKSLVGRAARLVAEEAIQMHGGIAMTWEYPVSHYAKRLVMLDHQLGDSDFHLERVMAAYRAA